MSFLLINKKQLIALHPEGYSMNEVADATLQMIKADNPVSPEAKTILSQRDAAVRFSWDVDLGLDKESEEAIRFIRERI